MPWYYEHDIKWTGSSVRARKEAPSLFRTAHTNVEAQGRFVLVDKSVTAALIFDMG